METPQSTLSAAFLAHSPTSFPPSQPLEPNCRETQCNNHGACMVPASGGSGVVCYCDLGYQGDFCEKKISGALSVPLTLSVLGIIFGLLILAFVSAKLQRKKWKQQRRNMETERDDYIAV